MSSYIHLGTIHKPKTITYFKPVNVWEATFKQTLNIKVANTQLL